MKHDVFISYSSLDKQIADAICSRVENSKIRCWIAPRDILGGIEYGEAIIDAIANCTIFVLVFSTNANNSIFVRKEVERAISKGKILIPFRIENILPTKAMEFALSNTHWLDAMTPPMESHINALINTINRLLNNAVALPTISPQYPPQKATEEPMPAKKMNLSWLMKTTNGPGQRSGFGMIYDDKKEGILLHGGFGSGNENDHPVGLRMFQSPHLSDTWIWNGSFWQLVQNKPLTLQNYALASNKSTRQNFIHGGWNGSQRMDETYIMLDNDWIKTEDRNVVGPEVRDSHVMVYDEKRKSIILCGGSTIKLESGQASQIAFGDTWEFNESVWTKLHVKGPEPRWGHTMVYDENIGVVVLFGGYDGSNYFNDTWIWEGNTAT